MNKVPNPSTGKTLDQDYWDTQYQNKHTGWDLGSVSPPIQSYVDRIEDKAIAILIPGCGNSYEAEYLVSKGFSNITLIDIAPTLVANLQQKFAHNPNINIILGDFFEHQGQYDLIIEQTFFCALPPYLRQKYVWKMYQLLATNGSLAGLLFNRTFDAGPPFGGNQAEYEALFKAAFKIVSIQTATNSATPRANTELAFEFKKNNGLFVQLFELDNSAIERSKEIKSVLNVSISSNATTILLVSKHEILQTQLQ